MSSLLIHGGQSERRALSLGSVARGLDAAATNTCGRSARAWRAIALPRRDSPDSENHIGGITGSAAGARLSRTGRSRNGRCTSSDGGLICGTAASAPGSARRISHDYGANKQGGVLSAGGSLAAPLIWITAPRYHAAVATILPICRGSRRKSISRSVISRWKTSRHSAERYATGRTDCTKAVAEWIARRIAAVLR